MTLKKKANAANKGDFYQHGKVDKKSVILIYHQKTESLEGKVHPQQRLSNIVVADNSLITGGWLPNNGAAPNSFNIKTW